MKLTHFHSLLRVAGFILGFVAMFLFLDTWYLHAFPTTEYAKYQKILTADDPADVVIIGSSIAVHGVIPAVLKTIQGGRCDFSRTYNFAEYGAQPIYFLEWYRHIYRARLPQPSLVIVALDRISFDASWRRLEQDARYLPLEVFFQLFLAEDAIGRETMIMNRFGLLQAGFDVKHLLLPDRSRADRLIDGYFPVFGRMQAFLPPRSQSVRLDMEAFAALGSLLDDITADGSAILLVHMPALGPDSIMGHEKLVAYYKNLARRKHIPLIDFNSTESGTLSLTPTMFSDNLHLNATGSLILSRELKTKIEHMLASGELERCAPAAVE